MHEFRLSMYMAIIHEAFSANNDFLVCFRIVSLFSLSLKLFLLRSVFHSFVAANSHPQRNIHGAMVAKIPKPFQPPEHMDGFFNPTLKKHSKNSLAESAVEHVCIYATAIYSICAAHMELCTNSVSTSNCQKEILSRHHESLILQVGPYSTHYK